MPGSTSTGGLGGGAGAVVGAGLAAGTADATELLGSPGAGAAEFALLVASGETLVAGGDDEDGVPVLLHPAKMKKALISKIRAVGAVRMCKPPKFHRNLAAG
ncbi:MAG TPA: hypothetical protein VG322_11380 [Candidatus Acidoferrales bacterium]|nr:hypothetical protein [Candidatus Acidoferrales bacterium]